MLKKEYKIVLIGFMGSGKSTIGRLLAEELNLPFVDLDEYIIQKSGKSISKIFKEYGEQEFRKIERECLQELLSQKESMVIASGGGTPCFAGNLELMKSKSMVIYLQSGVKLLTQRLTKSQRPRPLIRGMRKDDLERFIRKLLRKRRSFYLQADMVFRLNAESPIIAQRILRKLPD